MRIAIAADQDFVASCFGCCPACMIVDLEGAEICRTVVIPNAGWSHKYWADLLERNSVACLITGQIGTNALGVIRWRGVEVISGVKGPIDDVVKKYVSGAIHSAADVTAEGTPGHPEQDCRFSKTA
jgi:predicted Fe-Mo cluster-binding NifX family protein